MLTCDVIVNLNFRSKGEQPVDVGPCNFAALPRLGELIEVNYNGSMIIASVTKVLHRCGGDDTRVTLYADRIRLSYDTGPL